MVTPEELAGLDSYQRIKSPNGLRMAVPRKKDLRSGANPGPWTQTVGVVEVSVEWNAITPTAVG